MPQTTIPTNESEAKPQVKLALTREEAAGALSISTATIDRLTERGLLKPSRAIRRPLYPISEIKRFLKETQGRPTRVKARYHE